MFVLRQGLVCVIAASPERLALPLPHTWDDNYESSHQVSDYIIMKTGTLERNSKVWFC